MFKSFLRSGIIVVTLVSACKNAAPPKTTIQETQPILEIGNEKFSLDDFQDAYNKNKFASDSTRALTPQEYLALYTEQKIKVAEAKSSGKDTTLDYREEITSYREQLAKNQLVDKALVEKLTNEAYNRLKQEVRASHILIRVSEDASPADTLEAYRAATALRGRLEEGTDFGSMAAQYSKDPQAKTTKGDLGYFTAFQTLYPIETAAYTLPVGKLSQPVRTKAGYHLIKVTDRRTNRGMVQIAHIMVQADSAASAEKKAEAQTRINEAYQQLTEGKAWADVVYTYSDDNQSKKNNGLLPMFGIGQMVPEIEQAAFALSKVNDYSKPVKTIYGWHIVRLVEKRGIESFTVMAPSLRKKVVTDSRGKVVEQLNAKRLRQKYTVREASDQWALVSQLADSSLQKGKWDYIRAVTGDWAASTLFSIEEKSYDALSFLNYVKRKQQRKPADASPQIIFRKFFEDYVTDALADYEKDHLEDTNPEFRSLMNEIRDGVLLSQMMEENVWQKSLTDSTGQMRLYEQNKGKYNYPERAFATVIAARDTAVLNSIRRTIAVSPYKLERRAKEILFPLSSEDVEKRYQEDLREVLVIMQKNPDYIVEIAGYRSSDEPEIISANRIRNAQKYLTSQNVPIVRIIEKDYGSFRQSAEPERNRRLAFQFYSKSLKDIEKVYNAIAPGIATIEEGYFTKNDPLMSKMDWKAGEQTVEVDNRVVWADIKRINPARGKTFAEARGSVINDYQKILEKEWLEKLHQRFPVKVNAEELEKIKR